MNDGTTLQSSEPTLCANGCGFFGTSATMNLCSKCYREDLLAKEQQASSAKAAVQDKFVDVVPSVSSAAVATSSNCDEPADLAVAKVSNRCSSCRKKFGVMGFKCRCGNTFCGIHRYPEKHDCEFDFKAVGSLAIAKANPVVKADKIERI